MAKKKPNAICPECKSKVYYDFKDPGIPICGKCLLIGGKRVQLIPIAN